MRWIVVSAPASISMFAWPGLVCEAPVNPITRMPAARAPVIPCTESSMTMQRAGSAPIFSAA